MIELAAAPAQHYARIASACARGVVVTALLLLTTGAAAQKVASPAAAPKSDAVRQPVPSSTAEAGTETTARDKVCAECGVVRSIRFIDKKPRSTNPNPAPVPRSPAGATGGPGGMNAGGGAVKNLNKTPFWTVTVRMDNGTTRNYTYVEKPEINEGDKVRTRDDGRRLSKVTD